MYTLYLTSWRPVYPDLFWLETMLVTPLQSVALEVGWTSLLFLPWAERGNIRRTVRLVREQGRPSTWMATGQHPPSGISKLMENKRRVWASISQSLVPDGGPPSTSETPASADIACARVLARSSLPAGMETQPRPLIQLHESTVAALGCICLASFHQENIHTPCFILRKSTDLHLENRFQEIIPSRASSFWRVSWKSLPFVIKLNTNKGRWTTVCLKGCPGQNMASPVGTRQLSTAWI